MMYGDGWGWGWGGMMIVMPLVWIALTAVIVLGVLKVTQRPDRSQSDQARRETAQEILDRRFASGEIDADAYAQTKARLAGQDVPSH
ncbi:SHOCT domain-containing protein [Kribbella sp. NPDC020789]